MNRIKEVLDSKGIKQTWLAEKLNKATIWSIVTFKTEGSQALKIFTGLLKILEVSVKDLLVEKEGGK